MNLPAMSTNGLKALLGAIRCCLEEDDQAPSVQDKPYGVRELPDWKAMSDQLETELDQRGETYTKVPW
jgi:hypothetical protein